MKPARIAVLAIALLAGGIAAFLAGRSDPTPPPPAPVVQLDTVDVLIANVDIGMGHAVSDQELRWQTWPTGAAGLVLLVAFVCFSRGWIGGGDAKLAAATALWLGFDYLTSYLIYASLFGGALTLLLIQFRMLPLPRILVGQEWAERLHRKDTGVPYGIALAAAALAIYPDTPWMPSVVM